MTQNHKRGFTLIELLVVIAIIAVLASIMFPVFAKAKEKAAQSTCLSNLKQLATASAMYVQDNKRYPEGATWVTDMGGYMNNNKKMFTCPTDPNADGYVSYNYNGCLNGADGKGITSESVLNASETGLCIDGISKKYPEGKTINGGTFEGRVDARHDSGYTIAYVDGHASYTPKKTAKTDGGDASGAYGRAFFYPQAFGWINNPGAGIIPPSAAVDSSMFTYGGSSTVEPVFQAALKGFTQKGGYDASFTGIEGSGHGADAGVDIGGSSKLIGPFSVSPATNFTVASCVATDALGIIVSAATKLPLAKINKADAVKIFKDGDGVLSAGTISTLNIYERTSDSGTWAFFNSCLGMTAQASTGLQAGVKVIPVASQSEMIAKVSADPYGIGYSSLGDVDPNAATILNLDTATGVQVYTRAAVNKGGAGWVMQRPLFAKVNTANAGATALLAYINDAGTFQKSLPYQTSYFAPKAEANYPSLPLVW